MNATDIKLLAEIESDLRAISFVLHSTIYTLNDVCLSDNDINSVANFFEERIDKNCRLIQDVVKNEQKNRALAHAKAQNNK